MSKNMTMTLRHQIKISSMFFGFMVDLEQSGTRMPDARSTFLTFWLIATFILQKVKTELENL